MIKYNDVDQSLIDVMCLRVTTARRQIENDELKKQIRKLYSEIDNYKKEETALKERIEELSKRNDCLEYELENSNGIIRCRNRQLVEYSNESIDLKTEIVDRNYKISELEKQVEKLNSWVNVYTRSNKMLHNDCAKYYKLVENIENLIESYKESEEE